MPERIRYWEYKAIWSDVKNNHDFHKELITTTFLLEHFRAMFRLYPQILTRIVVIDDEGNTYRVCGVKD